MTVAAGRPRAPGPPAAWRRFGTRDDMRTLCRVIGGRQPRPDDFGACALHHVMKFCNACGGPLTRRVPDGDNLPRHVCTACATIHYQNPLIVVGCVPEYDGRILLCKRAIEPRLGYWTVPAGFMEIGETLEAGAAREAEEEALATVEIRDLMAVINVPHARQVHVMFRGDLADGRYGVGHESLEVELVAPGDIPWADLAFPSVTFTLERYLADLKDGCERLHVTAVGPMNPR